MSLSVATRLLQVDGEEMKAEFEWLRELLSSCYGPQGNRILLHSTSGGVVTLTKRSLKLLQLLKPDNPLLKMTISHLQGHAQCHGDSALYAGMLTCNLVLRGMNLQMPRRKVAMAINHTLSLVVDWLNSEQCPVTRELDMCSVKELVAFLASYMGTKASMLSQQSVEHLSTLILKAFLRAMPSGGGVVNVSEHLYLLAAPPTCPAQPSSLWEGLLLAQDMCASDVSSDSFQDCGTGVVTALFDTSLAGDVPEGSEFNLVGVAGVSVDAVYLEHLMSMGRNLIEKGVGLVACQKCIHPTLKDCLHQEGIVVLERLSSLLLIPVHRLCGGDVLSTLSLTNANLGILTAVNPLKLGDTWYVQLKGVNDSHSSLLLCCDSERQLDELQPLVHDAGGCGVRLTGGCGVPIVLLHFAVTLLEHCAGNPRVLCGGGCADTSIAHYIRDKVQVAEEASSAHQVNSVVMEMVAQCFEQQASALNQHGALALTDSHSHHCWFLPPPDSSSLHTSDGIDLRDHTCNCGSVLQWSIPADSHWTAVPPSGVDTPPDTPPSIPHQHYRQHANHSVLDLVTPRVGAFSCASGLADMILTTAFILTQHH